MRNRKGFTFLEVLLAVAIVVALVAVMADTIGASFKLKNATEQAIQGVRDAENTGDTWLADVRSALPPSGYSQVDVQNGDYSVDPITGLTTQPATQSSTTGTASGGVVGSQPMPSYLFGPFYGDTGTMQFYTSGQDPNAQVQAGVLYVQYSLEQQSNGTNALVRRVETNLLGDNDPTTFPSGLPTEVIVANVESVDFEYYDGTNWTSTWDSTSVDQLPFAARMTLSIAADASGQPAHTITRYAAMQCAAVPPTATDTGTSSGLTGFGL